MLALAGLCASFMFTLVVPIQLQLPELLNASREDTAWVVTVTLLAAAVTTPISGRLGDMYGKRRILLLLLAALVVGSAIAALSTHLIGVVIGRALQGTVSGVIPLAIAILRDVLHERHLETAIALLSATMGIGGAIGMPVAAVIAEATDWHVLFWVSAGMGAVVFALTVWVVPVSVLRAAGRFDFVGAMGLIVGLTSILLAVSRGNEWGWTSPPIIGLVIGGAVVLLLWAWYELRTSTPLLDLRVATRRPILLTNLASIGMGFALFGSNVVYPQLLELRVGAGGFGLSMVDASLVIMAQGAIMIVIAPFAGRIARRYGPKLLLTMGALGLTLAYALSLFFAAEVWQIVVANLLIGIGIGFGFAAMPMLIMRSVSPAETGASNGLNSLCRSIGTSTAGAVLGAILANFSVVHDGMQEPTPSAFTLGFAFALGASLIALIFSLTIPRHVTPSGRRTSLPDVP